MELFYAKKIAVSPEIGTSNWGFSISIASILSFLLFSIILVQGKTFFWKPENNVFWMVFFLILILSTTSLCFFDKSSNEFLSSYCYHVISHLF